MSPKSKGRKRKDGRPGGGRGQGGEVRRLPFVTDGDVTVPTDDDEAGPAAVAAFMADMPVTDDGEPVMSAEEVAQMLADPVGGLIQSLGGAILDVAGGPDPLEAEASSASVLPRLLQVGRYQPERVAADDQPGLPVADVLDRCVADPTPEALALALILAELATDAGLRERAGAVAAQLRTRVEPPAWAPALGRARLVGAWETTDVYGDQANVLCAFDRGPLFGALGLHGLVFLVDFNGPGVWIKDLYPVTEVEAARAELRTAAAESGGAVHFVEPPREEVHDVLAAGLAASLAGQVRLVEPDEDFWDTWVLAAARLRSFAGTAEGWGHSRPDTELERLVTEFCRSAEAAELDVPADLVERYARLVVRYGNEADGGRPLRVGPGKTVSFLAWAAGTFHPEGIASITGAERPTLVAVVGAWNAWAGRRAGLPEDAVEALQLVTDIGIGPGGEILALDGAAVAAVGDGADGADGGDADGPDELPAALARIAEELARAQRSGSRGGGAAAAERRRFAMPYRRAVIDGVRYDGLDPEDEDDLQMLVLGEYPEYQPLLEDPYPSEPLAVGATLHVSLLALAVARVWHDHPAGTWAEAQRLLGLGLERRDVLEILAARAGEQILGPSSSGLGLLVRRATMLSEIGDRPSAADGGRGASRGGTGRSGGWWASGSTGSLAGTGARGYWAPSSTGSRGRASGARKQASGRAASRNDRRVAGPGAGPTSSFRVRVDIVGARPPIWRRLVLPATMTLAEVHLALQLAFGWTDSHLHTFSAGYVDYGNPGDVDGVEDEHDVRLRDVLAAVGDVLAYEYDFGDSWQHRVVVEEILPDGEGTVRCLGGRRAGPPEDCGGIWMYNEIVAALEDPRRAASSDLSEDLEEVLPEMAEMLPYGPAHFDREMVNDRLRRVPVS